jgi:hypothetical protein
MTPHDNHSNHSHEGHDAQGRNVKPDQRNDRGRNWDDNAHMSPEMGKSNIENERRNLNPDQEKRSGEYNPDRDRRR